MSDDENRPKDGQGPALSGEDNKAEKSIVHVDQKAQQAAAQAEVDRIQAQLDEAKKKLAKARESGGARENISDAVGSVLTHFGQALVEIGEMPRAVEVAKIRATMHEQTVAAERERMKDQAEVDREQIRARQATHARTIYFAGFALIVCAGTVFLMVERQRNTEALFVIFAYTFFAATVLNRPIDAGFVDAIARAMRRDGVPLPSASPPQEDKKP